MDDPTPEAIQAAMNDAIIAVENDCTAVWNDEVLTLDEKNAQIAVLNDPDAVRARMLAAAEALTETGE